jgi:hypothetical protein
MVCQHKPDKQRPVVFCSSLGVTQSDSGKYAYYELNISLFILPLCQKSMPWINILHSDTLKVARHDELCVHQSGLIKYFSTVTNEQLRTI